MPVGATDKECIHLCLNGQPEMFRLLVSRYEHALFAHLMARLGAEDEAREIAQEAMVRAYFALSRLEDGGAFFPWLLGIANRVTKEAHRKRRWTVELPDGLIPDRAETDQEVDHDRDQELRQAVAALSEPHRQVIQMRFYGGQSCAEISNTLGISLGTVTSRLSRAYTLLRDALLVHEPDTEFRP